jgi:hypothetical protein
MLLQSTADWAAIAKSVQMAQAPPWVTILDAANKAVQTTAIIVGGVWAYYRFVKGRIHRPRLEIVLEGEAFRRDGRDYAIVSISLKNVGVTDVKIQQKGSALRVFGCVNRSEDEPSLDSDIDWNRIITLSIFEKHGWIQSSELIHDKLLVSLPSMQIALRLDVRIVSKGLVWRGRGMVHLGAEKVLGS